MKKTTTKRKVTKTTQTKPKRILIIGLVALGLVGLLSLLMSKQRQAAILTNNNNAVCAASYDIDNVLECENLTANTISKVAVPKKFSVPTIQPSPDGTKLLIQSDAGRVVVTDLQFNELQTIFENNKGRDKYATFSWNADSSQVIVREVRREQGDADFLPVPLVISMVDVATGESRRVYKTGEKEDREIDLIGVIGANDTYLFLSLPTAKNWVARETSPPPNTLQAIRLSDGLVRPISSDQVNSDEVFYDGEKDQFLSVKNPSDNEQLVIAAKLKDGDNGLALDVTDTINIGSDLVSSLSVMTNKGVWASDSNMGDGYYQLMNGKKEMTTLQLKLEKYGVIMSLQEVPQLSEK